MRRRAAFAALLAITLFAGAAAAIEPGEMLSNPKLEARARHISQELRCLVCQNESIYDSQAPLAYDLRMLVRRRILAGDTNKQVIQYIVARYGTFVLLKPPLDIQTIFLWFGPLLVLVAAGGAAYFFYRREPALVPAPLSPEEQHRLDDLMTDKNGRTAP